jgi:UDP-N-acetylglucosamine--N-acetylmuramyl-(pentapeptide) pyrophosphoryl-undecaprenol N-acetylglucosamine transferase
VGRPSLLIPYPFAGDHQRHNALALERAGAALCVLAGEATSERLAAELSRLILDESLLPRMAGAARTLGKPDAAQVIAADLLDLAGLTGASGAGEGEAGSRVGGTRASAPSRSRSRSRSEVH